MEKLPEEMSDVELIAWMFGHFVAMEARALKAERQVAALQRGMTRKVARNLLEFKLNKEKL